MNFSFSEILVTRIFLSPAIIRPHTDGFVTCGLYGLYKSNVKIYMIFTRSQGCSQNFSEFLELKSEPTVSNKTIFSQVDHIGRTIVYCEKKKYRIVDR